MNHKELIELFDEFTATARETMISKNKDYADEDALSNFKKSARISGITPEQGCLNQIAIKVSRAGVLLKSGVSPQNESLADTAGDMFVYSFLFAALLSEHNLSELPY